MEVSSGVSRLPGVVQVGQRSAGERSRVSTTDHVVQTTATTTTMPRTRHISYQSCLAPRHTVSPFSSSPPDVAHVTKARQVTSYPVRAQDRTSALVGNSKCELQRRRLFANRTAPHCAYLGSPGVLQLYVVLLWSRRRRLPDDDSKLPDEVASHAASLSVLARIMSCCCCCCLGAER